MTYSFLASEKSPAKQLALGLVIAFFCLDYFYRMSTGLVVPELIQQYATTPTGIGAFASAFYAGYVLFQLPSGYMLDKWPLQRTISGFIIVCSLTFLCFIYAHHLSLGVLLRLALGCASALSFIAVLHIARLYFASRYFGLISGLTFAAGTLTSSLIQTYTAYAMHHWHWHTCLALSGIVSLIIAILFLLPALKPINQTSATNNTTPRLLSALMQLMCQPGFVMNALIGGLFYLPTSILAAAWGVSLFEVNYHLSKTAAAFCLTLLFAGWSIGSPIIGYFNETRLNQRLTIRIAALAAAIISILMIATPNMMHSFVYMLAFLFGLFSSAQVSTWNIFNKLCPRRLSGIGIALTNMIIMLCAVIFHLVEGMLITHYSHTHNTASLLSQTSLSYGLWIIPLLFLATAVLSCWLPTVNVSKT